jgi:hypothetical protein
MIAQEVKIDVYVLRSGVELRVVRDGYGRLIVRSQDQSFVLRYVKLSEQTSVP